MISQCEIEVSKRSIKLFRHFLSFLLWKFSKNFPIYNDKFFQLIYKTMYTYLLCNYTQ